MTQIKERIVLILEKAENNECLCTFSAEELEKELYYKVISSQCENIDQELLAINALRKIAEAYTKNAILSSFTCPIISKVMQLFCDDDVWLNTASFFRKIEDKFLLYGLAKFLAATFYTFPQHLFCTRMKSFLKDLNQNTDKKNCDLELLKSLIKFESTKYLDSKACLCQNKISCIISASEDIFTLLCSELSKKWEALLDVFLRKENDNIDLFLNLWRSLCERKIKEEFLLIFFKEDFAIEFLTLSLMMSPETFRLLVDITSQIFSCNLKKSLWKHLEEKKFEVAVINALSAEFFQLLSTRNDTSSLCSSLCRDQNSVNEGNNNFDATSRKVIFIVFNLLAEFRNTLLLCQALEKVFYFFASNLKPHTTYLWIVETFMEEDDLLFGVLLASLRIYCNLKNPATRCGVNNSVVQKFMEAMDPHKSLIKFFQLLGNDHNELLSFLLSDETCFLLYLLQYLKLLLTEWKPFFEAHSILCGSLPTLTTGNTFAQLTKSGSNKLVSYSSSSSSEEEESADPVESITTKGSKRLEELSFQTVSVLINLKTAIQKLVDINEFPYNISPLVCLLNCCEKEYYSLR